MEVKFTKHAVSMLKERSFTADQVKEAVKNPSWTEKDGLLHIFKREENKVLHVVGKEETHNVYNAVSWSNGKRRP
mgnify:CR=1 FL=1